MTVSKPAQYLVEVGMTVSKAALVLGGGWEMLQMNS